MDWLTAIALPLVGGLGYYLRRLVEKKDVDEQLDRRLKALQLKTGMQEAGISETELDQYVQNVQNRTADVRLREDAIEHDLHHSSSLEPLTQIEMNFAAAARAEQAELVLARVYAEYADQLERDDAARLKAAMDAWETLVENHAQLAANVFRGGTMAPLAYAAERERMTITRIAEIEAQVAERARLIGTDDTVN